MISRLILDAGDYCNDDDGPDLDKGAASSRVTRQGSDASLTLSEDTQLHLNQHWAVVASTPAIEGLLSPSPLRAPHQNSSSCYATSSFLEVYIRGVGSRNARCVVSRTCRLVYPDGLVFLVLKMLQNILKLWECK